MADSHSQLRPLALLTEYRSLVVEELLSTVADEDTGVAYVYLDYADKLAQTVESLTASLIKQLSLQKKSMDGIQRLYEQCEREKKGQPDISKLEATLQTMSNRFKRVFFVLDALDECEENVRISMLKPLHRLDQLRCRFFFTRRPHLQDLQRNFRDSLQIVIKAQHSDIKPLVEKRIEDDDMLLELVEGNECLKTTIVNEIVEHAKDM